VLVHAAWALIGLLALVSCAGDSTTTPSATPGPSPSPRVVILSIDGLRADAIDKAETPNIHGLIARGARASQARTIALSNTLPAHTSMLCGYPVEVHRVLWDDYQPNRRITTPTLFTATRRQALRSVMVVGKEKFQHFRDTGEVDSFSLTLRGDDAVANEAIVQLGNWSDLMFVHFPDVDLAGHASGWLSANYLARVGVVDRAIGRVLAAIPASATVIVTADHGGSGFGHGTNAPEHVTIPWIIAGPGIRRGVTIDTPIVTMDTAATAARILRLDLPSDVSGRVVSMAFE
jgi:predicted AlkP superfamily pyrophosphatase or phosphodiesterase